MYSDLRSKYKKHSFQQEESRLIVPWCRDALILKQTYRENHLNCAVIRARKLLVDVYFGRAKRAQLLMRYV